MLVLTLLSAALAVETRRQVRTLTQSQVTVILGAQRLKRLAQVSQLTVQLAVSTGDPTYVAAHSAQRTEVEQAFAELERSMVIDANKREAAEVERMATRLSKIETAALEMREAGNRDAAMKLLQSPEYTSLEGAYLTKLAAIRQRSTAYSGRLQRRIDVDSTIAAVAGLVGLPLIALTWLLVLMPARRWGGDLDKARIKAQAVAEAKAELVAVLSHELRNPLNSIRGFTELLLSDETLNAEQLRRLSFVDEAGSILMSVIEEVLDFSALEAGKMSLRRESFALADVVQQALSLVRLAAEAKALELRSHVDPDSAGNYLGDPQRLRQVLLNLLGNAVKFTDAGSVELAVSKAGGDNGKDWIRFEIADTGPGIDPNVQARLFESYSRGDGSAAHAPGSGLGLNISKRLVDLMDGEIGVSTETGKGSRFWFEIPLDRSTATGGDEAAD